MHCEQAEKSSAELQRVREQRQGAEEALRREEALLRDLDAETAALTAKRVRSNIIPCPSFWLIPFHYSLLQLLCRRSRPVTLNAALRW
jgi:hypothetical protein